MDIGMLIPALGGYWLLVRADLSRFGIFRLSGYHLFFTSAFFGIVLYLAGWLVAVVAWRHLSGADAWLEKNLPFPDFDAVVVSLVLAFALPMCINRWTDSSLVFEKDMRTRGHLIHLFLREAMQSGRLVELSMRNRKSYVGYVVERGGELPHDSDVGLIPLLSGYRERNTLRVAFITNYSKIIGQCGKKGTSFSGLSLQQLRVFFPSQEIVSARNFNLRVARHFGHTMKQSKPVVRSANP